MNQAAAKAVLPIRSDVDVDIAGEPKLRDTLRQMLDDDSSLSQARISKETGISAATFSQWLAGRYPGKNDDIDAKVRAWLQAHFDRMANDALPQAPDWIETPSAERVIAGLRYAQLAGDMVIIQGNSGVGKTKAIERYVRTAPNVWHATMTPSRSGIVASLNQIAVKLGFKDGVKTADALHGRICRRVDGTNGLLVIDEAQHLGFQALDQIRAIHDETKIGICLVGNESIYTRMTVGPQAPFLDRLYSRIGKRIKLGKATEADIDKTMKAWGLTDKDCRKLIHDVAGQPGALRTLTKTLRLAASYAQAEGKALCCEYVRAAWLEHGGLQ